MHLTQACTLGKLSVDWLQGNIRKALISVHWRRFSLVALLEVGCCFGLLLNPYVLQQLLLELQQGARTGDHARAA